MPNKAKSHTECRNYVCIICMSKSDRSLTPFLISRLTKHSPEPLDLNDDRLPHGMCTNCRFHLQKIDEGKATKPFPNLYDFSSILVKQPTQKSPDCNCIICKIAKTNGKTPLPMTSNVDPERSPPTVHKRCSHCLTIVGPGLPHHCTPATRRVKLLRLAKEDTKLAEVVASSVLKTHDPSPNGTVRLSQASGGPKLPLKLGMSI